MKRHRLGAAMALLLLGTTSAGISQTPPAIGHSETLLLGAAPAPRGAALRVTSPSFADRGDIPVDNTQYGTNRFPGLAWTAGPAGTRSYMVAMQGTVGETVASGGGTSIHFTLVNVPAGVTSLPAGLTTPPAGAIYGLNVHGVGQPYMGPHTHNATKHEYHLQVFALDTLLPADPAMDYAAIAAAMRGHVLASGEVVGLAAMPPQAAADPSVPQVKIDSGMLSGVAGRDKAVRVYKGIPYAAAPIGPLRWRAPEPLHAWQGVRPADKFGALCPQPSDGPGPAATAPMDEDCLTLNVWTGATAATEKRPVLVWIYGGGFLTGTGANPEFDGEGLAKKGVIVVTFNYRIGALGFLATPELSRESGHSASGNYGLLDDIAALQWVKRNIAAFGGDPARVTIAGQSAGAGSVGFLSQSPLAKGLFQRSIAESHARTPGDPDLRFLSVSYRPLKSAEAAGEGLRRGARRQHDRADAGAAVAGDRQGQRCDRCRGRNRHDRQAAAVPPGGGWLGGAAYL